MSQPHILALDQGTTSSRAIVFDALGRVRALAQQEFTQHFPRPGWVEHDAQEIWRTQLAVARAALAQLPAGTRVAALGVTNQRETTVLWDRATGEPVAPALVWQDRRTAADCERLRAAGHAREIQRKTGLVLDAYFSGTKLAWLLTHVPGARARAERGELAFGTIDSWLIYRLTGGRVHATDASNASRTLMFDIHRLRWDDGLLAMLDVPESVLPRVLPSCGVFGETDEALLGRRLPIAGVAGDQQAATFGQACFAPGMVKNTYGTGCFMLMNTGARGEQPQPPAHHGRLAGSGRGGSAHGLVPGRVGVRGGRHGAVAARRFADHRVGAGDRGAGGVGGRYGRRVSGARVRGPGRARLGSACARHARWADAR
jgi:glycerol kinase